MGLEEFSIKDVDTIIYFLDFALFNRRVFFFNDFFEIVINVINNSTKTGWIFFQKCNESNRILFFLMLFQNIFESLCFIKHTVIAIYDHYCINIIMKHWE